MIQWLKSNSSSGIDGVNAEHLHYGRSQHTTIAAAKQWQLLLTCSGLALFCPFKNVNYKPYFFGYTSDIQHGFRLGCYTVFGVLLAY